ncbi:MAG: hypothetical protein OXG56_00735, partial [Gammaproteobacteria bacterium]|nr:hypothetical protein [Gammaproteobacteria bacterium]
DPSIQTKYQSVATNEKPSVPDIGVDWLQDRYSTSAPISFLSASCREPGQGKKALLKIDWPAERGLQPGRDCLPAILVH